MGPGRKLPFSGKAKKEQLKLKRQRKQLENKGDKPHIAFLQGSVSYQDEDDTDEDEVVKMIHHPKWISARNKRDENRYALKFYKETKEQLEARKKEAFSSLVPSSETELEINSDEYFPHGIDFPRRPPWNFDMTRDELDVRENRYFTEYVKELEQKFNQRKLSYFELNLETWRQLWRVLEISDIVLIIVDIRYAALMFPPSIYKFICEELKKDMILVLNKIDLAPAHLVIAWKYYFLEHYPTIKIITFTSYPSYNLRNNTSENKSGLKIRRRRGKLRMAAEGAQKLYETCKEIVQNQVDLTSWAEKIADEMNHTYEDIDPLNVVPEKVDTSYHEHERFKSGTLTIGCIGQPNVGKSSLMNAIMGKKVVSVSRTPGHTKHFQTIYLTNNVILCDCPGLVFPSLIPRNLQILIGAYPIAQVREPYSAVKYLAERVDLPKLLNIRHSENDESWSAMDICDGWARQRGFFTAKAARPDVYRAANSILRMALEGKICLCLKPPNYCSTKDFWENHEEVTQIEWIQAKGDIDREGVGDEEDDLKSNSSDSSGAPSTTKKLERKKADLTTSEESDEENSEETHKNMFANKFNLLASTED